MGYSRKSIPSTTLVAAVRRYYGLTQQALGAYLGVGTAFVGHIESGRKALPSAALLRLTPLATQVPDQLPPPVEELPAWAPAPAAATLEARRDYCLHHAARLRRQLRSLQRQATYSQRWRAALPAIVAALPAALAPAAKAADAAGAPDPAPANDPLARTHAWVQRHTTQLSPDDVAQWHLLRLQAAALEAEAATLTQLLG